MAVKRGQQHHSYGARQERRHSFPWVCTIGHGTIGYTGSRKSGEILLTHVVEPSPTLVEFIDERTVALDAGGNDDIDLVPRPRERHVPDAPLFLCRAAFAAEDRSARSSALAPAASPALGGPPSSMMT